MGRTSTKENKNSYQLAREELGLTREKASELLETIAPERIEKIENERTVPRPDEVLTMAEKYKRPSLCNCYCSQQCPIGQRYVPFVTRRELPAIILEMLASLNAMNSKKERLIEIAADGKISNDEIDDFIHIRQELERISLTVETLQLWTERMLANGQILVQRFGDILDGKRTWQKELAQSNIRPTLPDAVAGDITAAMPYRAMVNIIEFIKMMDEVVPGFASPETLLYSPELKFYSNKVKMDTDLETNIAGLHCLGDSSGWTRGLMMASVMGVLMGRKLIENHDM